MFPKRNPGLKLFLKHLTEVVEITYFIHLRKEKLCLRRWMILKELLAVWWKKPEAKHLTAPFQGAPQYLSARLCPVGQPGNTMG